ncbi:MAG: exonuclease domain-containing protein, partial [bacterium]
MSNRSLITLPVRFVAVDVETTGLDFKNDRVIEIAAVLFENGRTTAEFNSFVNPGIKIEPIITNLTGITQSHIDNSPVFEDIAENLMDFLDNNLIIAHNVHFDKKFLEREFKFYSNFKFRNPTLDSITLCRMAFPFSPNHQLKTLSSIVNQDRNNLHRALCDASTCGKLAYRADSILRNYPKNIRNNMYKVAKNSRTYLSEYIKALSLLPESDNKSSVSEREKEPFFGIKTGITEPEPVVEKEILDILGENSLFASYMDEFENRPHQIKLAKETAIAFNKSKITTIEAGTGIGKTLGYLVSSVLWSVKNNERVIISTKTKGLQEQLIKKDLPLLKKVLGDIFSATILKGRNNYVCLRRWHYLLNNSGKLLKSGERRDLLTLIGWIWQTQSGDIFECTGFHPNRNQKLFDLISSSALQCLGSKCGFYADCFVNRQRGFALKSNIVIINHALLFADISGDYGLLGTYNRIIFDEAHALEQTACQFLGTEINNFIIKNICDIIYDGRHGFSSQLIDSIEKKMGDQPDNIVSVLLEPVKRLQTESILLQDAANDFFNKLCCTFESITKNKSKYLEKFRYKDSIKSQWNISS